MKKRKFMSCFLVFILVASVIQGVTPVQAATSGDYNYTDNGDGTCTVIDYTGTDTVITIPSTLETLTVTAIGGQAFHDCSELTSVTIQNGVTTIGAGAFIRCTKLASITIPSSVTFMGDSVFSYCSNLTGVTIPDGVTVIGDSTFDHCEKLTSVTIPDSVTSIGNNAFNWCLKLTGVTLPDGVTSIGDGAFKTCVKLTGITLPDGITSIGQATFYECVELAGVTIPYGVTSIGLCTFDGCAALPGITIPSSVTSIGQQAFNNCGSLTSVTIPSSVTSIAMYGFYNCGSLAGVYFDGNMPSLGSDVFAYCSGTLNYYCPEGNPGGITLTPLTPVTTKTIATSSVNGAITPSTVSGMPGETISLSVTPAIGYILRAGSFQYNNGAGDQAVSGASFTMPDSDITVSAVFDLKTIAVGSQNGTITERTVGSSATFTAATENIANHTAVTVNWCDAAGNAAAAPAGLSAAGTNVASNGSTITVTSGLTAATGTYYFKAASSDVTSGVVTVTVSPETVPPTVGTTTITTSNLSQAGVTLSWNKATDNISAQTALQYLVYRSGSNDLDTVDDIEHNGTAVGSYAADIAAKDVTGLTAATTYYFNVIVRDETGNKTCYEAKSITTSADTTVPTVGTTTITSSSISQTGVTLSWNKATDETSAQTALQYLVYRSGSDNLDSVDNIEANGTAVGSYAADIATMDVTGLTAATTYYFNVIVKDEAGNKTCYATESITTSADTTVPTVADKTITSSDISQTGVSLSWNKATDETSAQTALQYLVYRSGSDNLGSVDDIDANGTAEGSYAADIATMDVTGLTAETAYYFNVIVKDEAGNRTCYTTESIITAGTAPSAINKTIASTGLSQTGVSLSWNKATDETSAQTALQYLVYRSGSNNLDSVANIEANGTAVGSYTADIAAKDVTGLTAGTTYYFNVIVKDEAGNKTCYTTKLITTLSSGGGDGGGGGGDSSATSTYNASVKTGNGAGADLPVTVNGGAGTASIDISSQSSLGPIGTTITLPAISGVDTYTLGVPVSYLSTSAKQETLTVETDLGSIAFSSNMLAGTGLSGNNAGLSIGQGDKSSLPESVREAIGDRPLIQLSLYIDGRQTAWNNPDAPVTVAVPYTPTEEELADPEHIVIWYIDGSGNAVQVTGSHYDPTTGTVVFSTTHFSYYAVAIEPVIRLAGTDRMETALNIARAAYPGAIANAVIATAGNYPDALAGSVLAYRINAPIFLVGSSQADQKKVLDYLKANLNPDGTVYILGGAGVIGQSFEDGLKDNGMPKISRLAGEDRYKTSVVIAGQLEIQEGTPVVLVSGENYPNALSVSSIAAQGQLPILLVSKDGLSEAVRQKIAAIKPAKIYIIGLERVISRDVASEAAQLSGLAAENIVRIGGEDRYATSLAVAQYFNLDSQTVGIATGGNYPDALAGSVYAAKHKAPIILTRGSLLEQALNYLQSKKLTEAAIFGGEAAVGKDVEQQLRELIEP